MSAPYDYVKMLVKVDAVTARLSCISMVTWMYLFVKRMIFDVLDWARDAFFIILVSWPV